MEAPKFYIYCEVHIFCASKSFWNRKQHPHKSWKMYTHFDYLDHNACRMMILTKGNLLTSPPAKIGKLLQRLKDPRKLPNLTVRPTLPCLCVYAIVVIIQKNSQRGPGEYWTHKTPMEIKHVKYIATQQSYMECNKIDINFLCTNKL